MQGVSGNITTDGSRGLSEVQDKSADTQACSTAISNINSLVDDMQVGRNSDRLPLKSPRLYAFLLGGGSTSLLVTALAAVLGVGLLFLSVPLGLAVLGAGALLSISSCANGYATLKKTDYLLQHTPEQKRGELILWLARCDFNKNFIRILTDLTAKQTDAADNKPYGLIADTILGFSRSKEDGNELLDFLGDAFKARLQELGKFQARSLLGRMNAVLASANKTCFQLLDVDILQMHELFNKYFTDPKKSRNENLLMLELMRPPVEFWMLADIYSAEGENGSQSASTEENKGHNNILKAEKIFYDSWVRIIAVLVQSAGVKCLNSQQKNPLGFLLSPRMSKHCIGLLYKLKDATSIETFLNAPESGPYPCSPADLASKLLKLYGCIVERDA